MPYPTLPDRRMPYDNDGTVVFQGDTFNGITSVPSGSTVAAFNATGYVFNGIAGGANALVTWWFFPEQREVSAIYFASDTAALGSLAGSNDTTNGVDGTWESATFPGGVPSSPASTSFDWRSGIKAVSFTGPKRVIKATLSAIGGRYLLIAHLYGQKAAGQTPDDVIYLDQATAYAEFTAPIDFGDMPLGTTAQHQFKVKNASATHTANTINIQCNDTDFAISSDGVTWVNTINIASLAAGASSGVLYVRDTTPNPGHVLLPRYARIVTTVASWT